MKKLGLFLSLFLVLAACQPAPATLPSAEQDALFTQAAQTVIAQLTAAAPAATATSAPVATDTPAASPTEISSPTPAPTMTPEPTETPPPTATQTPIPNVIFEEDFEAGTGWFEQEEDNFAFEFVDGAYRIRNEFYDAAVWSIREMGIDDVYLQVDASLSDGAESGFYGLICRHVDEDNFYALLVSPSGRYGIGIHEDGEFIYLIEGTNPEVIQSGSAVNRVGGECVGDSLTLFANGQQLAQVTDSTFDEGEIGLVVKTTLDEEMEAIFDQFIVARP